MSSAQRGVDVAMFSAQYATDSNLVAVGMINAALHECEEPFIVYADKKKSELATTRILLQDNELRSKMLDKSFNFKRWTEKENSHKE